VAATRHAASLMPGDFRDRVFRPQGWLSPVLLVDGRIEGVWSHELGGGRVDVGVAPFGRTTTAIKTAVEAEAERLAAFLGGELALRWS
jgi:Winged helix DNA-binding domain